MSRVLWFVAGAGATVYAMNKARRLQETFTVEGLKDRANGLALGAKLLRDEVAQGRVEKELELRERLGLVPLDTPALPSPGRHRSDGPPEVAARPESPGTPALDSHTDQEGTN